MRRDVSKTNCTENSDRPVERIKQRMLLNEREEQRAKACESHDVTNRPFSSTRTFEKFVDRFVASGPTYQGASRIISASTLKSVDRYDCPLTVQTVPSTVPLREGPVLRRGIGNRMVEK